MTSALLAGLVAGYGVAVPVGAIAVLIIGLTARTSFRVGAAGALGVATADGLYAAAAVLGGTALDSRLAPYAVPLRWVAAGVLVLLAGLTVRAAVRRYRAHRRPDPESGGSVGGPSGEGMGTPGRAYRGLLGLTLLNPMTIIYFVALVVGRQAVGELTRGPAVAFVMAAFAASASWQLVIAGGGSLVGRALTGPRGRLGTGLAAGLLIAVLAARLVLP